MRKLSQYVCMIIICVYQPQVSAQLEQGLDFYAKGYIPEAISHLQTAYNTAKQKRQDKIQWRSANALAKIYLQRQDEKALPLLQTTWQQAKTGNHLDIAATSTYLLGLWFENQQQFDKANTYYQHSLQLAKKANAYPQQIQALLGLVTLNQDKTLDYLQKSWQQVCLIQDKKAKAVYSLKIAEKAKDNDEPKLQSLSYQALLQAYELTKDNSQQRLHSKASGQLGALYASQQRWQEAMQLTEQAIILAQRLQAHDLLLQWQWQAAKLWLQQQDQKRALLAFEQAVSHINAIRNDMPVIYQGGRSSFRETLEPVYLGYVDLLLQQTAVQPVSAQRQKDLLQVRDVMEQLKTAELQDYFQDLCAVSQHDITPLEQIAPRAAIIYPIILPQRVEILVSIGSKIQQFTIPVTKQKIERTAYFLASRLRQQRRYQAQARRLYQWLIAPLEPILTKHHIDTLVFVPDGALRLVPFAALQNQDQKFIVEQYAVVVEPGLTLFEPVPLQNIKYNALIAGVSEPGDVVATLPHFMLQGISTQNRNLGTKLARSLTANITTRSADEWRSLLVLPEIQSQLKVLLALPGVATEVDALAQQMPSKVLLNESFQLAPFSKAIAEVPYNIVHIASHGYFGGEAKRNFVLAYDQLLTMNKLQKAIQSTQAPIELLTLSACYTAEGDDRAPLGLSGVAIQAGARSVLGSLWPVADQVAQQLLPDFYQRLSQQQISKAKALQQSQLAILKSEQYQHPFFWAPFILIGNWL